MFRAVVFGVNQGTGAAALKFAEKDAKDVRAFLSGALGPLKDNQIAFGTGTKATAAAMREALDWARKSSPDQFVFYFSGHGNEQGFLLRDGIFSYQELRDWLKAIRATASVIILDVCSASSYLDFLKKAQLEGVINRSWIEALASATPGTRLMFSTGKRRTSIEGGSVSNGHFTYALLQALQHASGDLSVSGTRFVSDQRAFSIAKGLMRKLLGSNQEPVERNLTGTFPLARSQDETQIGDATFSRVSLARGVALEMKVSVFGRRNVKTTLICELRNLVGTQVAHHQQLLLPDDDDAGFSGTISFDPADIRKNPVVHLHLVAFKKATLVWNISLIDSKKRVLDRKVFSVIYKP